MAGNAMQGTQYEMDCSEALELRLCGDTFAAIGKAQDVSASTAMRRVNHAIDQMRPHADYDEYRARQLAELEKIRTQLYESATDVGREWEERGKLIDRLVKIHDRESKLLALDKAPTPMEEASRELAQASPEDIAAELDKRNKVDAGS